MERWAGARGFTRKSNDSRGGTGVQGAGWREVGDSITDPLSSVIADETEAPFVRELIDREIVRGSFDVSYFALRASCHEQQNAISAPQVARGYGRMRTSVIGPKPLAPVEFAEVSQRQRYDSAKCDAEADTES